MSKPSAISAVAVVALGVTVLSLFNYRGKALSTSDEEASPQAIPTTRCVFLQPPEVVDSSPELSAALKERTKRESHGYPKDISLDDALTIFNAELKCYPNWAMLPPLTEQEIIATAIGGPDYGDEPRWQFQKSVLRLIASKRVMPKGSLFVAESGGCEDQDRSRPQTCVKGLKIYLFLGLDQVPRESGVKPEQIILVRKTYFDTETR